MSNPHTCRDCGCTNENACQGGCTWAEYDLCSNCKIKEILEKNGIADLRKFLEWEFEGREIFQIQDIIVEDLDINMDDDYFIDLHVKMVSNSVRDFDIMMILKGDPPTLESDDSYQFSPEKIEDIEEKWKISVELGADGDFHEILSFDWQIKYLYMTLIR